MPEALIVVHVSDMSIGASTAIGKAISHRLRYPAAHPAGSGKATAQNTTTTRAVIAAQAAKATLGNICSLALPGFGRPPLRRSADAVQFGQNAGLDLGVEPFGAVGHGGPLYDTRAGLV